MAKKQTKAPVPEPTEKVVYLRVSPADYAVIEDMKRTFYQATVNQAVIKGLHDWQALKMQVINLRDELNEERRLKNQYYDVIEQTAKGLMASQALITSYNKIIKGQ